MGNNRQTNQLKMQDLAVAFTAFQVHYYLCGEMNQRKLLNMTFIPKTGLICSIFTSVYLKCLYCISPDFYLP